MSMYERIENLRKSRKISQGKLETELGFSNGSISKWRNSDPTPERLKKLADYFEVSIEYLLTGEEKENEQKYYINKESEEMAQFLFENPEYKVLFDASRKVKQEDIQFVKEMIDRMSGREL